MRGRARTPGVTVARMAYRMRRGYCVECGVRVERKLRTRDPLRCVDCSTRIGAEALAQLAARSGPVYDRLIEGQRRARERRATGK